MHHFAMSPTLDVTTMLGGTRLVTTPSGVFRTSTHRVAGHDGTGRSVLVVQRGVLPSGVRAQAEVHVECTTGDVLSDLRCGCGLRLRRALRRLGRQEHGVLLYLRRDGSCRDAQDLAGDAALVELVLDRLGGRADQ